MAPGDIVICKDVRWFDFCLTYGKEYMVLDNQPPRGQVANLREPSCLIRLDNGDECWLLRRRFIESE